MKPEMPRHLFPSLGSDLCGRCRLFRFTTKHRSVLLGDADKLGARVEQGREKRNGNNGRTLSCSNRLAAPCVRRLPPVSCMEGNRLFGPEWPAEPVAVVIALEASCAFALHSTAVNSVQLSRNLPTLKAFIL